MNNGLATVERVFSRMVDEILAWLRSGDLEVGDRLPTEPQLAERYGISVTSVRKGIDVLVAEGIVVRRQGDGTYVANPPPAPRATRLRSVLVGWEWDYTMYHPYFTELLRGVREGLVGSGWEMADLLVRLTEPETWYDDRRAVHRYISPDMLRATLRKRSDLAGLVLSGGVASLLQSELPENLPVVVINPFKDLPCAAYDWAGEVARAIGAVVQCGCRSVAVLTSHSERLIAMALEQVAHTHGSSADLRIIRHIASHVTSTAQANSYRTAAKLFRVEDWQPDGIVVTDDYASQGVLDAMTEAGIAPLPIACMINRESRLSTNYPLMRLIFDGFGLGQAAARLLDQHIRSPYDAPIARVLSCTWEYDRDARHPEMHGWNNFLKQP